MRLTGLINELTEMIEMHGNVEILNYKISDETGTREWFKLSPDRKDKDGYPAKMNYKEFNEYRKLRDGEQ